MAKPQFHDILPPDGRSIKKIPIPDRAREKRESIREPAPDMDMVRPRSPRSMEDMRPVARPAQPTRESLPPLQQKPAPREERKDPRYTFEEATPEATVIPKLKSSSRRKWPIYVAILALLIIIGLVYFFIPKVTGANITLTPKGQTIAVDSTFIASKDTNAELPYQVAVYGKDGKLTLPANGQETVQVKATGVIRIFNNFSATEQKLIANTRFATPQGKIFRINQAVTVPGKSVDTPGSVDATVTADAVGADYNVGLTDFTIPGFKGDPKYDKIYGRSKTAIDGGFSGTRSKVDKSQLSSAREKIHTELENSLVKQMQQNIPENFIFPKNSYFIEYESLPDSPVDGGVQITERATFHGIMFKRDVLAGAIAKKVGTDTVGKSDLANIDNLTFSTKIGSSTKPWDSDTFSFKLNGTTTLISSIDIDKLKNELKGKPRKSLNAILAGYPGVAQAEVVMRPFWVQTFPDSLTDIMIKVGSTSPSP